MCGIVGYVGKEQAAPILLDGLRRLEYRGYDSAGIAVCGDGYAAAWQKSRGRLAGAQRPDARAARICLARSASATPAGPPTASRTISTPTPTCSQSGRIAVVHNGIIENYIELKEQLLHKGYTFRSETDTEVVAQLLDYYYTDCGDIFEAMVRMLHAVDGSYALGIICADFPDRLLCARKDAPLLLGFGEGENFIASDVTALIRHTRDIAYLDDGELAILSARRHAASMTARCDPVEKERLPRRLGRRRCGKGRLRALHAQRDPRSSPMPSAEAIAARIQDGRVVLRRPEHDRRGDPQYRQDLYHRLRLVLSRRRGRQV